MEKLKTASAKLRLNQKFTVVIFCVVLIPVMLLTVLLFHNTQTIVLQEKMKDLESSLYKTQADLDRTVELCSLTTQFYIGNTALIDFLILTSGERVSTQDLVTFYKEDVGTLERLVSTNPYLYQVRVYHPGEDVPEIMPILYHESRLGRLDWGNSWSSGQWQLDYDDLIFTEVALQPTRHIMSLVTAVEAHGYGRLGVLEVAVRMDDVFPSLYAEDATCALVVGDALYTDGHATDFWTRHYTDVAAHFDPDLTDIEVREMVVGGERTLVAAAPMQALGGVYLSAIPHSEIAPGLAGGSRAFLAITFLLLLVLMLVVNLLVTAMLGRFYAIVDAVDLVREGDLDIRVPDVGEDEVGVLGEQINRMLDRIQHLMQENIDRQLLHKNAEIKALQSQINTHFIYNVLESIKMMAEVDEHYDIADAINALGKLMRYSMRWPSPLATLAEEVDNIHNYLALINLRFDYQIALEESIPAELRPMSIPKMTLQPIVENAVVHGNEALAEDTRITLAAERAGGNTLVISVTDYGRGIEPHRLDALNRRLQDQVDTDLGAGGGIGLKNVHDRIAMTCGPGFGLSIESDYGSYTCVHIRLPIEGE